MGLKKGQVADVVVSDLAIGGKGLAKIDGLPIFIDHAVPLDHVTIRIVKKKKKYAEARVIALLEPSPYRIAPRCEYSGFCGGCKWQFLEYSRQLEYKRQHVADALAHIGLIHDVPVLPVIPSPDVFRYRNKMEFSCSDQRWLLPHELGDESMTKGFGLGLHVPGTFNKIIDISKCYLQFGHPTRIEDNISKYR